MFEGLFQLQGTLGDLVLDGLAFEERHGEKGLAVGLVDLVDGANVLMIEARRGRGFPDEAGLVLGVVGGVRRQELEGDGTFELGVLSLVNDTHPALAEFLGDLVVGDGGAGLGR